MKSGGCPDRFWNLTLREIEHELRALAFLQTQKRNESAWLAWHVEALHRTKKMPALKDFVIEQPQKRKTRSWEESLAEASAWASRSKH